MVMPQSNASMGKIGRFEERKESGLTYFSFQLYCKLRVKVLAFDRPIIFIAVDESFLFKA